MTKSNLLVSAK